MPSVHQKQSHSLYCLAFFKLAFLSFSTMASSDPVLVYRQLMDRIQREYAKPITTDQLLEGSLQGMLESLDSHSTYFNSHQYKEIQNQTRGNYGGIGIEIIVKDNNVHVISPIDDGPAFKAGIEPGDMIVAINGEPTYGMSPYKVAETLRGEPSTKVIITIKRGAILPFEVTLKRELVKHHPIKAKILESGEKEAVGYVRLSTFNELTTKELKEAIFHLLRKSKTPLKGFIFDVRNNTGGLLDQAISASNLFIKQGIIVSIRNRDPQKNLEYKARGLDILEGKPIVVLVNAGSASSAEIFAGALQDNHRALIVGTRSFGKGSVQTIFPLPNGGAMKLTTAYYYTPSGKSIHNTGIIPDIEVKQLVDVKSIDGPQCYQKNDTPKSIDNPQPSASKDTVVLPLEAARSSVAPLASSNLPFEEVKDYQLDQAINIVKAIDLKTKLPAFVGR